MLVGYRGRTSGPELQAKLERLRGEARGWPGPCEVPLPEGPLVVYPVERVIAAHPRQGTLWGSGLDF